MILWRISEVILTYLSQRPRNAGTRWMFVQAPPLAVASLQLMQLSRNIWAPETQKDILTVSGTIEMVAMSLMCGSGRRGALWFFAPFTWIDALRAPEAHSGSHNHTS